MKTLALSLLLAVTLSAQAIPGASTAARLKSILREIDADAVHKPTSILILVPTSDSAVKPLATIDQISPMVEPLVSSRQGEIAILSYGDRIRTIQPFTSDPAALSTAIADLRISAASVRMTDAVAEAISDLEARPDRRRILLLIADSKFISRGLGGNHDLIDRAERSAVLIYAIPIAQ
jgi:hypothetical protein